MSLPYQHQTKLQPWMRRKKWKKLILLFTTQVDHVTGLPNHSHPSKSNFLGTSRVLRGRPGLFGCHQSQSHPSRCLLCRLQLIPKAQICSSDRTDIDDEIAENQNCQWVILSGKEQVSCFCARLSWSCILHTTDHYGSWTAQKAAPHVCRPSGTRRVPAQ